MPEKTQEMKNLEERAIAVLMNNRKTVTKRGVEYGFTCPSPTLYHWQWLWDSCFHAIALRWFDADFAKRELLSLLYGQWPDGRIPNMVHIGYNWRFDRLVHGTGRDTSGITQPPLVADAVLRVHEVAPDKPFLEKVYEPLCKYYAWLENFRDTHNDGLIAMFHPWETGIDNSPRWDNIFEIKNFSRKKFDLVKGALMFKFNFARYDNARMRKVSPYFVKGIDMNCYYYANLRAMEKIANILGRGSDAEKFARRAEKTKASVLSKMYDPEKRVFGDLIGEQCRFSYVPTPFSFLPMWAGIASEEQAKAIHATITDPAQFHTEYPVPTTALDWPAFNPNGYWRGTVWINSNWLTIEGLSRHGFHDDANRIKHRTLELVDKGGFREYFNPNTGEGLGAQSFGWSTLVIDLMNRDF